MEPLEVFISYSHEDEELRKKLEKQLDVLRRQHLIKPWHDRRISAGSDWSGQINSHLQSADIILLLVSADFLASDYVNDIEIRCALEMHNTGTARVVPIILRPCLFRRSPLASLQALPTDGEPVIGSKWPSLDAAMLNVAEGIANLVEEISVSAKPVLHRAPAGATSASMRHQTEGGFYPLEIQIRKSILRVEYADITTQNVDVLVSSDDIDLSMGGGVSQALLRAGGQIIRKEANELGRLPLGNIGITTAGQLSASKIFHAAVLDYTHRHLTSMNLIRTVTKKCLQKTDELRFRSIAFPALAAGVAGLSPERSAVAMLIEIAGHLRGGTNIREVVITIYPRAGVQRETLLRFYHQLQEFIEADARMERLASALHSLEKVYRRLESDEASQGTALARGHIEANRKLREERLLGLEPEDLLREEETWRSYSEAIEPDLQRITTLRREGKVREKSEATQQDVDRDYIAHRTAALREIIYIRSRSITDLEEETARAGSREAERRLAQERDRLRALEEELHALQSAATAPRPA